MHGFHARAAGLILAAALSLPLLPAPARAFTDTGTTWAKDVIQKADDYGLMGGYPDGSFGVGKPMTRAEFVTVLTRMMDWDTRFPAAPSFVDCSIAFWGYAQVETAAAHNVMDRGGTFRPNDYISRAEMAEMLVRAMGYQDLALARENVSLPFGDVSNTKGYIAVAHDLGIINGVILDGQPFFQPTRSALREQAAAMLVRCYERWTDTTHWLHGFYALSSYDQINYTADMDAVSAGWARLEFDGGTVRLNDTDDNGNDWKKPTGSELVTDRLAREGVPLNLCVFADAAGFSSMVAAQAQGQALGALTDAARNYAGLTIDFEGLKEDQRANFTSFIKGLRQALPADKKLYVCVTPDDWLKGYDYHALGQLCDKIILMAHDYQWSSIPNYYLGTTSTYCPVTPLNKIYTALDHITDPVTGVTDRDKLALAISFNTTGFHVDDEGRLLDPVFYHPHKNTIEKRLTQPDSVCTWDPVSRNPKLEYTNEAGEYYVLWYENAQSVADKLRLARMFGVTGVSVWRLGTIPDSPHYNVWPVLSKD